MTNPITAIINASTGEEILREMSAEELAQWEAQNANEESMRKEEAAKQAARQSALEKLSALGLSPEEISAITGA
jgi:Holliday junction resolvasome RuvABC DNA-binding subunit